MKLIQKAPLCPKFEFTVRDRGLHVKRSTRLASHSFEIPFAEIDPSSSEHENIGIGWYLTGGALLVLGFTLLGFAFTAAAADARMGLWFGAFIAEVIALLCLAEGRRQTFSQIVFYSQRTGRALIRFQQKLPSPGYVEEFVEIVKEKIQAEADELKGYKDNWRG